MMKRILFFFLDGVGIGVPDEHNPFYAAEADHLPFYGAETLPDGTPVKPIDAVLGVDGPPQSASGQTTIYTGVNVPQLLGEHKGSYPNKTMRKIIKEKNILSRLLQKGMNAVFINAYPFHGGIFTPEHIDIDHEGTLHFSSQFPHLYRRRISVTSAMMIAAGQTPFNEKDIIDGKCVYQDYSNVSLNRMMDEAEAAGRLLKLGVSGKMPLPEFEPETAAEILHRAFQKYDFMLYEYFQTDIHGHRHSFPERVELVRRLNRLVKHLVSLLDPETETLLITSDHGNLEDGTSPAHTRNPVPLITRGPFADTLRRRIDCLADITPAILNCGGWG